MSVVQDLETKLNDVFVKSAPPLPDGAKKWIVKYLPYINLVLGFFMILTIYWIWVWAHTASSIISLANVYGANISTNHFTVVLWLGVATLVVEAILYIAAFPGTRDKKKSGWDLLFYALLVNVVYGILMVFTSYGGFGSLIGSIIGTLIGLYFLFQIRASYVTAHHVTGPHHNIK